MENLHADPDRVNLHAKSPTFYETGLRLARVCGSKDAEDLPARIKATLAKRLHTILQRSASSLGTDVSEYVATLTDMERLLFAYGRAHAVDALACKKRLTTVIRSERNVLGTTGSDELRVGAFSKPTAKRQRTG